MKKIYRVFLVFSIFTVIFQSNLKATYWIGKLANYTWTYTDSGRLKVEVRSPKKAGSYDIAEEFDRMLVGSKFEKYRSTIKTQIQCHGFSYVFNKTPWNIEVQRNQRDFSNACNTESWIDNLKLTPPPSYKIPPNICIGNSCMYAIQRLDK